MVIDSSAAYELVDRTSLGAAIEAAVADEPRLAAPDVLVVEVIAGLRRQFLRRQLTERRAAQAVDDLGLLPIEYFPTVAFRRRAWELRHNFTASDAMFATLAEVLDEPLLTTDRALAKAARKHLGVDVVTP